MFTRCSKCGCELEGGVDNVKKAICKDCKKIQS